MIEDKPIVFDDIKFFPLIDGVLKFKSAIKAIAAARWFAIINILRAK